MIRLLVILGLLCAFAPAPAAEVVGVTFPETTYDFGTVKQGPKIAHRFLVHNSAPTALTIQSVQLSIPGMNARFKPTIAPGGEGAITVEWDTSHFSGEMDAKATVRFGKGAEQQEILLLKGVSQPPLEILPYPAIFLSAFKGEDKESRLKVINHEEEPIAVSLSVTEYTHFAASLSTIQPGKIYEVVARIPSAALPGRYDEEIHLSTDSPNLPALTIPIHVLVKPDLYANPEAIDFGAVSADDLRKNPGKRALLTQTFLVKKRSGEFEIKRVQSNLDAIEVTKEPAHSKSATYRVDVSLNPEKVKPGKIAGFVELVTSDKAFPSIRVPVSGTVF